jgi:exodeoxyribonuclease V alpha subunit
MDTITGTLADIRFSKNGFLIGQLDSGETVKGNMLEPIIGQEYRLAGDWGNDPRWGRQFTFSRYATETPRDAEGVYRYLVRVAKWVGPIVGRRIVQAFGDDALTILKQDPQRAANDIKGLTLDRAEEISRNLLANEDRESAAVELESMLGGLHLPKHTITTLIETHHSEAPARVRQTPYSTLMDVRGIGFTLADRVAVSPAVGYDRDGMERRMAASLHALQEAAEGAGHTWLPGERFVKEVQELIGFPPGPDVRVKLIEYEKIQVRNTMVALAKLANDERDVAGFIHQMLIKGEDLSESISVDLKGLAPDQQEAFRLCLAYPVFILTGAPGTGKTYTLRRIIEQFTTWNKLIALAAPTGKAAKRMSEMIDMPAMTIHRLLGPEPRIFKGELYFGFTRGIGSPIPADLLVVDEFSMVDISLAASLFRAVARGTRVLIVGDHYQLPSVGPGAVLRDLLAAGVPSYELTEIKRNTGDIVQACHAIKDGRPAIPSSHLDLESGLNFRHIEVSDPFRSNDDDPPGVQEIIRDLVTKRLPMRGYDPVWDVQVLSPTNEHTALSCLDINVLLQGALNIHPPVPGIPFRIGDKVIQRKNEEISDEFVVNGDLGEVKDINDAEITVLFLYPDRLVRIKRKAHHLQLAYCVTIHKMQGSESKVIILPVHSCFGKFFNREIVYTAISRAQDICITVGEWHALEAAVGRVGNVRRITRLTELIKGE